MLDIGCGDGKISAQIASCLPNGCVVGVDSSEEMINLARRKFPQAAFSNVSFQVMDARKLSFHKRFNCVFSNAVLHWIMDHRSVLEGVQQSLKPGGKLVFQMGGKGNAHDILAVLDELQIEDNWKKFFSGFAFPYGFYAPNEYKNWLREAGFKPERVELLHKDMRVTGKEGLAGWVRTAWLPYTERLPAELREEFVREIVDRYVKTHPPDTSGNVHVAMVRLEVEACKP